VLVRVRAAVAVGMPLRLDFRWHDKQLAVPHTALGDHVRHARARASSRKLRPQQA
jgi:hypothetical protein